MRLHANAISQEANISHPTRAIGSMSSSLLRSKVFWAITASAGSIASTLTYDKLEAKKIRSAFIAEAAAFGEVPLKEGDRERKVNLVLFSEDSDAETRQQAVFRQYAVDLLTKAGIDYQLITFNAATLNKRYYQLKDEKEVKEIPNGQVPDNEAESKAKRPTIFTVDNFFGRMASSWFGSKSQNSSSDEIDEKVKSEHWITPVSRAFFEDGIVALDPGSFRALLWAYNSGKTKPETCFGLINCDFPAGFFKRLYMRFNTRTIADTVGRETMAVIRDQKQHIPLNQVLTSETTSNENTPIPIYK